MAPDGLICLDAMLMCCVFALMSVIPLKKAQEEAFSKSPLAKSLRAIYDGIRALTPIQILIGDIPVDIALPIPPPRVTEEWTRWGDEDSDWSGSSTELDDFEAEERDEFDEIAGSDEENNINEVIVRPSAFKGDKALDLKPWKTLLPLEFIHNLREAPSDLDEEMLARYQQLMENPTTEISEAVSKFVQNLDPTIPYVPVFAWVSGSAVLNDRVCRLYQIAAFLEMDLESEVYPLARYLIHIRKVKLIDVVRKTLRNVFIPESTSGKS